ncbi:MAG: hypothetical protein WC089_02395 [Candidatus Paceibacterota bacterium]
MKIYILPIEEKFKPKSQKFRYPAHNSDFGVEQDFYIYLGKNKEIQTNNPDEADWHYLPIFWTRWHLNHNYGQEGLVELQKEVDKRIISKNKTFTICQYDDGPIVDLGNSIQFLASRKSNHGIDIPLLSKKHRQPFFKLKKIYTASFVGRISTYHLRKEMQQYLESEKDILIKDGNFSSRYFVKQMMKSFTSLCPRGYGGSSFRFFESMHLGVAPLLIGDIDTRPFKKFIEWDDISFYSNNMPEVIKILKTRKQTLLEMGTKSKKIFENELDYQKWCKFVVKELEYLKNEK